MNLIKLRKNKNKKSGFYRSFYFLTEILCKFTDYLYQPIFCIAQFLLREDYLRVPDRRNTVLISRMEAGDIPRSAENLFPDSRQQPGMPRETDDRLLQYSRRSYSF